MPNTTTSENRSVETSEKLKKAAEIIIDSSKPKETLQNNNFSKELYEVASGFLEELNHEDKPQINLVKLVPNGYIKKSGRNFDYDLDFQLYILQNIAEFDKEAFEVSKTTYKTKAVQNWKKFFQTPTLEFFLKIDQSEMTPELKETCKMILLKINLGYHLFNDRNLPYDGPNGPKKNKIINSEKSNQEVAKFYKKAADELLEVIKKANEKVADAKGDGTKIQDVDEVKRATNYLKILANLRSKLYSEQKYAETKQGTVLAQITQSPQFLDEDKKAIEEFANCGVLSEKVKNKFTQRQKKPRGQKITYSELGKKDLLDEISNQIKKLDDEIEGLRKNNNPDPIEQWPVEDAFKEYLCFAGIARFKFAKKIITKLSVQDSYEEIKEAVLAIIPKSDPNARTIDNISFSEDIEEKFNYLQLSSSLAFIQAIDKKLIEKYNLNDIQRNIDKLYELLNNYRKAHYISSSSEESKNFQAKLEELDSKKKFEGKKDDTPDSKAKDKYYELMALISSIVDLTIPGRAKSEVEVPAAAVDAIDAAVARATEAAEKVAAAKLEAAVAKLEGVAEAKALEAVEKLAAAKLEAGAFNATEAALAKATEVASSVAEAKATEVAEAKAIEAAAKLEAAASNSAEVTTSLKSTNDQLAIAEKVIEDLKTKNLELKKDVEELQEKSVEMSTRLDVMARNNQEASVLPKAPSTEAGKKTSKEVEVGGVREQGLNNSRRPAANDQATNIDIENKEAGRGSGGGENNYEPSSGEEVETQRSARGRRGGYGLHHGSSSESENEKDVRGGASGGNKQRSRVGYGLKLESSSESENEQVSTAVRRGGRREGRG